MTFTRKDTRRFPADRVRSLAARRAMVEVTTNGRVRRAAKVKSDAGTSPGRPAHRETRRERRRIAAFAPPFLSTPAAAAATNRMSEYP